MKIHHRVQNKIYEDVRSSFTQNMDSDEKLMFLEKFPPFRNVAPILYRKRREHIPSDPKTQAEFDVTLEMFKYKGEKLVCIGDIPLSGGRRVLLFSSDAHLEILARAIQILQDATFRITPKLWTQTFIINASVTSMTFVPTVFALLPDKKRETYDAMFCSLKDNLDARGLELSAKYMMSGKYSDRIILSFHNS